MDVILSGAKDLFDTYALGYIVPPLGALLFGFLRTAYALDLPISVNREGDDTRFSVSSTAGHCYR